MLAFLSKVHSLACMTIPCPTADWPLVTNFFSRCMTTPSPTTGWPPVIWKGSGIHVPLSV
ncbi:unnamed protein product [Spirodela intermedia]|uniref:Uncharacterized protein n=1 Tax=Spirodela intermedia TaxID=51605 RepID=A0ABN7E9Q5_SPIIN|nr:unnamed protein product [Spirodela intermedia]